jgi:hypothetical protein
MMAMNKKEQAEMDALRNALAEAKAMRWPDYPAPAPVTRQWIEANLVDGGMKYGRPQKVARGWFYNSHLGGYGSPGVTYGCSDGMNHDKVEDKTSVQGAGRMYATKLEALQALRIELTQRCAGILASVDRQILDAGLPDADDAALSRARGEKP